jgi:mannan endo-1,6-alpha-mannosidase
LYQQTQDDKWKTAVQGIYTTGQLFFENGIMKEVACEDGNNCDVDQQSFKGYLARWWGAAAKLAPFIQQETQALLASTANAAIATCTGGNDGNACGLRWTTNAYDGNTGVGEQMAVLEVVQSLLQPTVGGVVTSKTGGTSQGDPSAGGTQNTQKVTLDPITGADKAGAGILTAMALLMTFAGSLWMVTK